MTLSTATSHVTGYFEGGQYQSIWSRGEVRFDKGMISTSVQSVCVCVCTCVCAAHPTYNMHGHMSLRHCTSSSRSGSGGPGTLASEISNWPGNDLRPSTEA